MYQQGQLKSTLTSERLKSTMQSPPLGTGRSTLGSDSLTYPVTPDRP